VVRVMRIQAVVGLSLLFTFSTLSAHEYWLDPVDSSITPGSSAIIDVRNGENFSGTAFPFDEDKFATISVNSETSSQAYTGRLGDYPALHPELNTSGLYLITVNTTPKLLTYKTSEQFNTFLDYHALDTIKARHQQRGLPESDIKERYFRSAKTVIQVNSTGTLTFDDAATTTTDNLSVFSPAGSVFELVLLDNPYSNTESVRVKLLYQQKPLSGRQVELFWKGATLLRRTTLSNKEGIATFKLLGDGDYLINAVKVTEPASDDVDWLSYWASLSFER